jgi:hypothetical protein
MRKIFTIAIIALSMNVFGQVPTNGLVGYWPFNGNANDESGNGHNGTVSGATLTTDRFGNANKAYSFNGTSNYIMTNYTGVLGNNNRTICAWVKVQNISSFSTIVGYGSTSSANGGTDSYTCMLRNDGTEGISLDIDGARITKSSSVTSSAWHFYVWVFDNSISSSISDVKIYADGILQSNVAENYVPFPAAGLINTIQDENVHFGKTNSSYYLNGKLDDIRIYNRALTQQEISALYTECDLAVQITPSDNSVASNGNAQFVASSVEPTATYQWQTNGVNLGWQNVPSNSTYSGGATTTLNVNNVQLSNHLQPFRVIATAGTCKDTSATARIVISDTCILTVTDTLVINATLTGLQAPNNQNTIKVYPNPANDHITIDYGNYANMSGYTLKITNTLGATVFTTAINQQTSYVDLNGWSGNGIYFVHLIDAQSNTLDIRKIVIQ